MRSFPSARHRLAAGTVGVVVALGLLTHYDVGARPTQKLPYVTAAHTAATTQGRPDSKKRLNQQQHHVSGQVSSAAADLDDASHAFTRATTQAKAARTRLAHARSHAAAVHDRLSAARTEATRLRADLDSSKQALAQADADLTDAKTDVNDQRDQVRDNVIDTYTEGDPELQAASTVLGDSGSLQELADNLYLDGLVIGRNDDVFHRLRGTRHDVATQQDAVQAATARVADQTHQATRQLAEVRSLYDQAVTAKHQVTTLVGHSVEAKQHALAVRHHDRQVLARLRSRERRIKQQILALAAHERGGYSGDAGGFLTNPARGYPITSPFGYRIHPIYGYYSLHNGIDYGVPCGTPLVAAADGTVINEYTDEVYGNRLYLNVGRVNGHNLTVVYNHLTGYRAHTGQHVRRGQVVAISGTTGWSTGCHLHFTVLQDGVPVNPVAYL